MANILIPTPIKKALTQGAALVLSLSGKDSQAMAYALAQAHKHNHWPGKLVAVYANLGRAAWPQSLPVCQTICKQINTPLSVVQRAKGDLVQRIIERKETLIVPNSLIFIETWNLRLALPLSPVGL